MVKLSAGCSLRSSSAPSGWSWKPSADLGSMEITVMVMVAVVVVAVAVVVVS